VIVAKSGGLSLSVKMIVTTTLLIVVTVVGSGLLNVMNVRRSLDKATEDQIVLFRESRETLGEVGAPLFAQAVKQQLFDKGVERDEAIIALARGTILSDTKDRDGKRDFGLKFAYVLDPNRAIVGRCLEGAQVECNTAKAGGHDPLSSAPYAAESFAKALAQWKQDKAEALVRFEMETGGTKYRVFAVPVLLTAAPTAAAALAEDPGDQRLGYVVLGYDLAPIDWFTAEADVQKSAAASKALLYTGAVGALFALLGVLFAILQSTAITRPIKAMAVKADQIARGDLEARVVVGARDEIGFLGENFNYMADQIAILLQQTAEKAAMEQELEVAKAIQETLVPTPDLVERGPLRFAGFYQPAAQTGGDWWTWHELANGKVLLVIGDVTGHGVPSAMITAAAKAAADVARHLHNNDVTVTRLLEIMNHAIYESAQRRFVMTCFASIIDTKTRTITYANAGHNFPYLYRAGENNKGEFGSLMIRGNRLGDDPTSSYESKTTELLAGDVLVWYTDGIVECENEAGEEYGEKRFRASVRRGAALDASEMRDAIVTDAGAFFGEAVRKDDITMIIGRIH